MGGDKMKLTKACSKSANDTGNADGPCIKDIGGVTGQLLEQNTRTLDSIADNFSSCQIHGKINPFSQAEWLKDAEEEAASWAEIDDRREAITRHRGEAR